MMTCQLNLPTKSTFAGLLRLPHISQMTPGSSTNLIIPVEVIALHIELVAAAIEEPLGLG